MKLKRMKYDTVKTICVGIVCYFIASKLLIILFIAPRVVYKYNDHIFITYRAYI